MVELALRFWKVSETEKGKPRQSICLNSQADKDSGDAQIARLKADLKASQDNEAELQKKVAAAEDQSKTMQDEKC